MDFSSAHVSIAQDTNICATNTSHWSEDGTHNLSYIIQWNHSSMPLAHQQRLGGDATKSRLPELEYQPIRIPTHDSCTVQMNEVT
jgi:hypothetical protein